MFEDECQRYEYDKSKHQSEYQHHFYRSGIVLEHEEDDDRYDEADDRRHCKFSSLFMFFDHCAEMFVERDFRLFQRLCFMLFGFFFVGSFYSIIQHSNQNNRYEIDCSQSEKVCLSSQYSDDQRL